MNPLRLLVVTRRFWPLVGSAEKSLGALAAELAARGHLPMVLTASWDPAWPARIVVRGVPVVRLPHAPTGRWRTLLYTRALRRWLVKEWGQAPHPTRRCRAFSTAPRSQSPLFHKPYDLVYVSGLRHEACAALRAVAGRVPVVLRADKAGRSGDCTWQIHAWGGERIKRRCMKAAAYVGPSLAVDRELKAAGYPRSRIHYLPDGVAIGPERTQAAKAAARHTLCEANSALDMPEWAPLAVYAGRLCRAKGLGNLVAAWEPIAARWPNARLWLAGEGPDQRSLLRQIDALGLTGRVAPIGVFDEVDDLLAAADLFVLPSPEGGPSRSLLEAMAAELPIVASDIRAHRDLLIDQEHGLLVPPGDVRALSAAMARLLDQPELAARLGAAARRRAAADFDLANMVEKHLTLFEQLASAKP